MSTQFESPESIETRQWSALQDLIRHAYESVPYWRDKLKGAGLDPSDIRSWDDFRAIPVLSKSDIRQAGPRLISSRFDPSRLRVNKTSGSTGVSVEIRADEESMQFRRACTLRADEWSGWRFGEPVAKVWGNPEYVHRGWRGRLRNALLERATYLDTLKMDDATIGSFALGLARKPPSLLFGHAHSVYLLAQFVRARKIGPIRPRGIITSAMVLHNWQRTGIEDVFGCRVTNRYGCEEVGLIACECEVHNGLHINSDSVYVEVVKDGRPASPGEEGSVVVTDLTNRAMPMLRYKIGDMAVAADRRCPCGRGLPLIERVQGREADYVTTTSGELISGISLTENFAMLVPGIAQLQIVQETVSQFRFRIVRGPGFGPESQGAIQALVHERFGRNVGHVCEFVDHIPPEPSGKYRFCISRVPNVLTQHGHGDTATLELATTT